MLIGEVLVNVVRTRGEVQIGDIQTSDIQTNEMQKRIEILYQEIGAQIKSARIRKGLTQDELSEMIHLSRPSIANIEHGRHKFQTHILYQISYALDCKIADLLPNSE